MERKGKERKSVGKVIKLGRELLFVFLLKATGIPTNGYIASDFKIRYLTGTHNVFPWVRIICMAKNQLRALRYRGGPPLRSFDRTRATRLPRNLGFRASCTLSRFVKLHPGPRKKRGLGRRQPWIIVDEHVVGWRGRVDTHPLPPRLNYRWIIYSASNEAEKERGKEREREMGCVERILRTPAAHRTDSSGCICPILPTPIHSSFSIPPYFNPLPLLSPCSRNY